MVARATTILPSNSTRPKQFFITNVRRMLLIMAGVEVNPGPGPADQKYKHLSGALKRKKARADSLNLVASDRKQTKLSFASPGNARSSTADELSISLSPTPNPTSILSPISPSSPFSPPSTSSDVVDSVIGESDSDSCSQNAIAIAPPDVLVEAVLLDEVPAAESSTSDPVAESGESSDPFAQFTRSSSILSDHQKSALIQLHPIQPETSPGNPVHLPFDKDRIYYQGKGEEKRLWLSYSNTRRKVYCWICHGFAKNAESIYATHGWGNHAQWAAGQCYKSVVKHERGKEHLSAVAAFMAFSQQASIGQCIDLSGKALHNRQVAERREVVLRVINVVTYNAKQGIAFRGHKNEAAHTLPLPCNHGNFLEEIKSRSKYDSVLKAHVDRVIGESQARHQKYPNSSGRGSLVTFLSKNTVKKLLDIISSLVLDTIKDRIEANGGKFSISLDGCQDISVQEMLCLVVRYVDEFGPVEVLVDISPASKTTGEALYKHVVDVLQKIGLKIENLVGYSFDGAGNMAGIRTGLQARLKERVPGSVFQHCYAHVLNLVLQKACNTIPLADSYFALLRDTATIITESYKRSGLWREVSKYFFKNTRLMVKFGKTRWWAKAKASNRLFQEDSLLPVIVVVLELIANESDLLGAARSKVFGELRNWCSFDTLAVGMLFHKIFLFSGPVSEYLQGTQLDHVQAARLTSQLIESLNSINIDEVLDQARALADKCNGKLDSLRSNIEFSEKFGEVESRFDIESTRKRIPTVPRRHGEVASDELRQLAALQSPNWLLKVKTLAPILNNCLQGLRERFGEDGNTLAVYKSCSFFSPGRFPDVVEKGIPEGSLDHLCSLAGVNVQDCNDELLVFAKSYESLKEDIQADFRPNIDLQAVDVDFEPESSGEDSDAECAARHDVAGDQGDNCRESLTCTQAVCKGCLRCPYRVLRKHGLYTSAFKTLTKVIKVALTLPCTQVTCERCFSKLKIIKNRLRSTMADTYLNSSLVISVERQIVDEIDPAIILDRFANSSEELRRLLVLE